MRIKLPAGKDISKADINNYKNHIEKILNLKIALEKSNYSKVKKLSETFKKVCNKLCEENKSILETLANIEPKNDS